MAISISISSRIILLGGKSLDDRSMEDEKILYEKQPTFF